MGSRYRVFALRTHGLGRDCGAMDRPPKARADADRDEATVQDGVEEGKGRPNYFLTRRNSIPVFAEYVQRCRGGIGNRPTTVRERRDLN